MGLYIMTYGAMPGMTEFQVGTESGEWVGRLVIRHEDIPELIAELSEWVEEGEEA